MTDDRRVYLSQLADRTIALVTELNELIGPANQLTPEESAWISKYIETQAPNLAAEIQFCELEHLAAEIGCLETNP